MRPSPTGNSRCGALVFSDGKLAKMKASVDVEHVAGAKQERAAHQRGHGLADVFGRAPAPDWRQAVGDELRVALVSAGGHVGVDDARPDLEDTDASVGKAQGEQLGQHAQPGLGDAVIAPVRGYRIGRKTRYI